MSLSQRLHQAAPVKSELGTVFRFVYYVSIVSLSFTPVSTHHTLVLGCPHLDRNQNTNHLRNKHPFHLTQKQTELPTTAGAQRWPARVR